MVMVYYIGHVSYLANVSIISTIDFYNYKLTTLCSMTAFNHNLESTINVTKIMN